MSKGKDVHAQDENELEDETSVEETQEENEEGAESAESEENLDESSEDKIGDDSEDESSQEQPEPKKRPVFTMPVSKAQKEKDKAVEKAREEARAEAKAEAEAEYQAKAESLKKEYEAKAAKGQSTAGLDEKLRKFAEEKGLDVDAAKGLLDLFKESIQLPDMSRYDELVKEKEIESHKAQVNREIDEQVIPLIKKEFPSATDAHLNKVKQEIAQLAFSKRFNTYAVADIYMVNRQKFEFKNGHSGEDAGGRSSNGDSLANLSEAEAMKLSATEYTKWQDLQAGKQSSYVDL